MPLPRRLIERCQKAPYPLFDLPLVRTRASREAETRPEQMEFDA